MPDPVVPRRTTGIPEPTVGLIVYDVKFMDQRWRVTGTADDDRIEAVRIVPGDGILHSWHRESWEHAWRSGWLEMDGHEENCASCSGPVPCDCGFTARLEAR